MFEYQNSAITQYYPGAGGSSAIRRENYATDNGIFYVLGDHLGSTSTIIQQNATVTKQEHYYPFGGNRGSAFSEITTKRFIGQYHETNLPGGEGLSFYNARWYDAQLGRFIGADTIISNLANPQSLNRLSYVANNPLRFIDPTGHRECEGTGNCAPAPRPPRPPSGQNTPSRPQPRNNIPRGAYRPNRYLPPYPGLPKNKPGSTRTFDPPFNLDEGAITSWHDLTSHIGNDWAIAEGTSLFASTAGLVVVVVDCAVDPSCEGQYKNTGAEANGGYGTLIIIEYGYTALSDEVRDAYDLTEEDSLYVIYAHLSSIDVGWGDAVEAGIQIGESGNTGNSSNPHLHLEIRTGTSGQLWSPSLCTAACRPGADERVYPIWRDDLTAVNPLDVWGD